MSLHDQIPCHTCGHPRYAHATRDRKGVVKERIHCRRCDCQKFVDDPEALAEHMVERQIIPQLRGHELGIPSTLVYTGPEQLEGAMTLTCTGCGRTAQIAGLATDEAAALQAKAPLCPNCQHLAQP